MGAPLLLSSSLRRRKNRKSSITNTSNNPPPPSSSSSLLDKLIVDVLRENEENESSYIQVQLIEEDEGNIIPSIGGGEGSGGGVRTNSSKMSNFAKRFSNSSKSSSGGDNRQNGSSSSSSSNDTGGGGGRDNNRHQNKDINNGNGGSNGGSGDGNNNNDDEKKSSSSKSNPTSPNYYSPERIQFANDCTLPQHTGSDESTAPINTPSWTPVSGTQFKVRAGPNYAKTGNKEGSLPSLYEVYNVRYFRSKTRTTSCMADIMPLPSPSSSSSFTISPAAAAATTPTTAGVEHQYHHHHNPYPELDGTNIPHVLIVHFTLPYESPSMFTSTDDGYGGECIYYLRPTRRFLDEVVSPSTTTTNDNSSSVQRNRRTPATQLFIDWCNTCTNNPSMRGRFKCMALVRDIDKHNFGPLLRTYNGKPVLITDSGSALSGSSSTTDANDDGGGTTTTRYIELTVNVHKWAYMAKKGFVSLLPKFKFMQLEVGFTIEAQDDTEMPECMLGSTVLSYISDTTGPVIRPEMQ